MRFVLVFGILAVLVSTSKPAVACSCAEIPAPLEMLARSDAVFSGTAARIEVTPNAMRRVTFLLHDCWKGTLEPYIVDVLTALDEARCGYDFEVGVRYLVYARYQATEPSSLFTHLCTRTRKLQYADEDLSALGSPTCTVPVESKTWGFIKTLYRGE